jgi:hypothetical protein
LSTNPEVDRWFDALEHPLKDLMQAVRAAVLGADERVEESIKWQSPTFSFEGNIASINPRARRYVSLMFHRGAEIPGRYPHLEGDGKLARYLNIEDLDQLESLRLELAAAVRSWCAMKSVYDAEEPKRR